MKRFSTTIAIRNFDVMLDGQRLLLFRTPGGSALRILRSEGAVPMREGFHLVIEGRIVGAIGISGGPDRELGEWTQAGADALQ